jgi:hypothetical protein
MRTFGKEKKGAQQGCLFRDPLRTFLSPHHVLAFLEKVRMRTFPTRLPKISCIPRIPRSRYPAK